MLSAAIATILFGLAVVPSVAAQCEDIGDADLYWGPLNSDPWSSFVFGPATDSAGHAVLQISPNGVSFDGGAEAFACSDPGQEYIVGYVADSATETLCLTASALEQNTTIYQSACDGSASQNFQYLDIAASYPLVFLGSQTGPTTGNTDYLATLNSDNVLVFVYKPGEVPTATSLDTPTFQLDLGE